MYSRKRTYTTNNTSPQITKHTLIESRHCHVSPKWSQLIVAPTSTHRRFLTMGRPVWTSSNPSYSSSTHIPNHRCTIPRPIRCNIPSLMAPWWAPAAAWLPSKLCPLPSPGQSSPRLLPRSHTQGEYGHTQRHLKSSKCRYSTGYSLHHSTHIFPFKVAFSHFFSLLLVPVSPILF